MEIAQQTRRSSLQYRHPAIPFALPSWLTSDESEWYGEAAGAAK
ncbi:hypothetical protein [Paenibacillus castaneae]|nr:hypothetical protein [Paenibacillus castaneae]